MPPQQLVLERDERRVQSSDEVGRSTAQVHRRIDDEHRHDGGVRRRGGRDSIQQAAVVADAEVG
jgi:hypothetical protein